MINLIWAWSDMNTGWICSANEKKKKNTNFVSPTITVQWCIVTPSSAIKYFENSASSDRNRVEWVGSARFFVNCGPNSISATMFPENEVICGPSDCCASVEIIFSRGGCGAWWECFKFPAVHFIAEFLIRFIISLGADAFWIADDVIFWKSFEISSAVIAKNALLEGEKKCVEIDRFLMKFNFPRCERPYRRVNVQRSSSFHPPLIIIVTAWMSLAENRKFIKPRCPHTFKDYSCHPRR